MKHLFRTMLFIMMMLLSVVAYAVEPLPNFLQGDFYDSYNTTHNFIMRNTAYTFFGKEVVSFKTAYQLEGDTEWEVTVKAGTGYDTFRIKASYGGITVAQTSTGKIYVAHKERIHNYKPKDSIGGIAPYMQRGEVLRIYGEPQKKEGGYSYNPNPNPSWWFRVGNYEKWTYTDGPWIVEFKAGQVFRITIPANSTKRFDNCGLGTTATYQDFYRAPGFRKDKYYDAVVPDEPGFPATAILLTKGTLNEDGYVIPGTENANGARSNITYQVND